MLTSNYGCVVATDKFTGSDTVLASLVVFFIYVNNRTTLSIISFIHSLMTYTLYQAIIEIKSPQDVL